MLVNLTPHIINVRVNQKEYAFPPSGMVARLDQADYISREVENIPVMVTYYGEITGLPEPQDGVIYIVSAPVLAATNRKDVVAPNTGPTAIRENGQVVAVTSFRGN